MDIGFIGLGKMGFPMARRLIEAKHQLVVFDQRKEAVDKLVALGAQAASSPKDVADRAETVMASLPSLQASLEVATGAGGVIEGKRVKRFVDLSTVGSHMAVRIHDLLANATSCRSTARSAAASAAPRRARSRSWCPGPSADFEAVKPALDVIGKVFFIGEKPGSAQTMKLANNLSVGDRDGRHFGGRGDGRQVGARSQRDDRRDQFRIGHEHREPRQISALDPAAHASISASPPD